ncbi:winged helix-turn-helix transcriptional regulator [Rhodococcus sp. G-MC3]|uniref:winged helix-turn-helix transcriptional regulator n=1 Tax=Rhodococcus sp. G-MC3 TaxID=3046209 RepID=UPI0024BB5BE6|nr:winged helix-turn-helix transcriptional regulator [Rhodococcus sp. G-MC3]MDJ0396509.1 winged helix-turn-helix transcriptional regulator [Rhodococcus sp. G-MC3]
MAGRIDDDRNTGSRGSDERNGIVKRVLIDSRPIAVECQMTPLGKTLREPVDVLLAWTHQHMSQIEAARDAYDDQATDAEA